MKNAFVWLLFSLLLTQSKCGQTGKSANTTVSDTPATFEEASNGSKTMKGFSAEYMTDICIDGTITKTKIENARLHSDCSKVVDQLDPEILRWPGGITAQYYHFNGSGYGFKSHEVKGTEYAGKAEALQEYLDINFIELFMPLARGRKVIYVANLLNGSLEENLQAINYLREGGADVIGVELGNEFYFSRMDPEEYLRRCEPYIENIKDVKLAVHMAPDFGAKNQNWNRTVNKADVDAIVLHEYNRKIKNLCKQSNPQEFLKCAVAETDEFTGRYIFHLIENYKRKYGNKEIWLTEWNVAPRTWGIYDTYVKSYHNFKMLHYLNELDIEIALFHTLVTGGPMYSVAFRKNQKLTYNPDFYVHQMLPEGKYLGRGIVNGVQLWYYSDGTAFANPGGSKINLDRKELKGNGQLSYNSMKLLSSKDLADKPAYTERSLQDLAIPAYSVGVIY